jgi:hypothetical protein
MVSGCNLEASDQEVLEQHIGAGVGAGVAFGEGSAVYIMRMDFWEQVSCRMQVLELISLALGSLHHLCN